MLELKNDSMIVIDLDQQFELLKEIEEAYLFKIHSRRDWRIKWQDNNWTMLELKNDSMIVIDLDQQFELLKEIEEVYLFKIYSRRDW